MEVGVRLNSKAYFKFYIDLDNASIDLDNASIDVTGEILLDDGTVVNPVGAVVWEDGE